MMYSRSDHPGRTDRPSGAERRPRGEYGPTDDEIAAWKRERAEGWHVPTSALARFDAWGTALDGPPRKQRRQGSWTFYRIGDD
jgi:hypothetical protein